ncbi:TIGR02302 family protein [Jiella marina]|uniref:TIGR02302 family protein n=1 Tax=Jiella sp. LLJ827 TaxID=2917712 RepID=UPI0021019E82|nr:TIGR02302 family protein [Jiella sp. LLJ827]MCQ0987677.1 TIGR02302 family protein [Jiella sp. LLJ827]
MAQNDAPKKWLPSRRLGWTRRSTYASILLERIWPPLIALVGVGALFLIIAWFGLFQMAGPTGRLVILVILGLCAVATLWLARNVRLPKSADVDQRIEHVSRLRHQPLRTQGEATTSTDPFAAALWREHQHRMAAQLRHLSGGAPTMRTERLDPFGMRALVALLLVTAFAFSFGPSGGRIADAFVTEEAREAVGRRVDAWVTPPAYTRQPPIFLAANEGEAVTVPEGSVLSVRVSDGRSVGLSFQPEGSDSEALEVPAVDETSADEATSDVEGVAEASADEDEVAASGPKSYEFALAEGGDVTLATSFSTLGEWRFAVTPDHDPEIAFSEEPSQARNGALQLAYEVSDDYGVRKARAEVAIEEERAPGARALVEPPEIRLALPRRTQGAAEAKTSADLTDSPYAGAEVALTLVAEDDAAQTGRSDPYRMTLPERNFFNPLARAVVEQRRILALDANAARRVVDMLDAVTLRGDEFIENPSDYLALRAVRTRIAAAKNDETLLSAVDFMWEIALGIEDGDLSLAERRLRDAREQLAEALENGASNEEIDRLMQELREAMQEYMQALAEAMRDQPPMSQEQMQSQNMMELRPQDLQEMLDRIEDLAKSGSKDAAQQLLSELQQMMDNLQAMRPGQQQQGQQSPMQEQMNKMGELLQRQQELRDQTYDLGRRQYRQQQQQQRQGQNAQQQQQQQGQQGEPQQGGEQMTAEEMQEMMRQLQEQQGQLQEQLEAMRKELEGMGMQPNEDFGEAGDAMGRAEGALGESNDGEAVGQQGRALEALRRGAQDMMQQMQQAMQQGQGQGQGQPGQMGQGFNGRQMNQAGRDPLGRQRHSQGPDFGQDVGVPDEIDTQRAREILDAIRERLGNALSPQQEREYLERLLETP